LRSFFDRLAAQVGLVGNVKNRFHVAFGVLETDRKVKEVLGIRCVAPVSDRDETLMVDNITLG
jgi:hypothetical protein